MRSRLPLAITLYSFTVVSHALVIRQQQSPVTIPFARRMNFTGAANIVDQDRARSKALREKAYQNIVSAQEASIFDVPAENQAVSYIASVRNCYTRSSVSADVSIDWHRGASKAMSVMWQRMQKDWFFHLRMTAAELCLPLLLMQLCVTVSNSRANG